MWGNIPSTNFLQMPRKKTDSLGLTGRFLYVQVRHPRRRAGTHTTPTGEAMHTHGLCL